MVHCVHIYNSVSICEQLQWTLVNLLTEYSCCCAIRGIPNKTTPAYFPGVETVILCWVCLEFLGSASAPTSCIATSAAATGLGDQKHFTTGINHLKGNITKTCPNQQIITANYLQVLPTTSDARRDPGAEAERTTASRGRGRFSFPRFSCKSVQNCSRTPCHVSQNPLW